MLELEKMAAVFSGVPLLGTKNGSTRVMRLSDLSALRAGRIPDLAVGEIPDVARASAIQAGDIIVAARGAATDVCVATEVVMGAFISLDLYLVRPDPTRIDSQYLLAFLTLPATQSLFAASKQGTGLPRLPKEELERVKIPVVAIDAQRTIAQLASSLEEESNVLKKLTELNLVFGREVIARAIGAAAAANHIRSDK